MTSFCILSLHLTILVLPITTHALVFARLGRPHRPLTSKATGIKSNSCLGTICTCAASMFVFFLRGLGGKVNLQGPSHQNLRSPRRPTSITVFLSSRQVSFRTRKCYSHLASCLQRWIHRADTLGPSPRSTLLAESKEPKEPNHLFRGYTL
jgi:hypothetical protein